MPVTINCSGSQTIYSGISAHFSCKCYVIYIAEKRKYANINEQIFEQTGTSNSLSRNSESVSLSGPHTQGHLCYQNKIFRNFSFEFRLKGPIIEGSLSRAIFKMFSFFCEFRECI